jgi:hypothetical protein
MRLRKLLSHDDFMREALGVWDGDGRHPVMPNWPLCATSAEPGTVAALAVAIDMDRVWLSVGAASAADPPHLRAVLRRRLDTHREAVLAEIARIQVETDCAVTLDRKGPAGVLEDDLRSLGVNVTAAGLDDYVTACADLYDAVESKRIEHGDDPELNAAVTNADKRKVGDRWAWSRRSGDISMLEAVTLAAWGVRPSAYHDRGLVIL